MKSLVEAIEREFFPSIYSNSLDVTGDLLLCLSTSGLTSRQCLAVCEFDERRSVQQQVSTMRSDIRAATGALWAFREVGAYLVFLSDRPITKIYRSSLPVDISGFHAVVVQGVHIIGADNIHKYNHAEWLKQSFSGAGHIADTLADRLEVIQQAFSKARGTQEQ